MKHQYSYPRSIYIQQAFRTSKLGTIGVVALKTVLAILTSIETVFFASFLDSLIQFFQNKSAVDIAAFFVVLSIWIGNSALQIGYKMIGEHLKIKLSEELSIKILKKKMRIRYSLLEQKENWELMERVEKDPSARWAGAIFNMLDILTFVIQLVGLLLIIASQHLILAIIVGILIVPYYFVAVRNGEEEYDAYENSAVHFRRARYFRRILTNRENADERWLFGFAPWLNEIWSKEYSDAVEIEKRANRTVFFRAGCANVASVLLLGVIASAMLWPVAQAQLTAGLYIAILKAVINYVDAVSISFSQVIVKFVKSKLYLQDFQKFLTLDEARYNKKTCEISEIKTIEFRDVSFSYPNTTAKILNHFSCVLDGGKQYAFVGENGAGKTTIIKLLTGFYDEYEGRILINGIELREINKEHLRHLFSVVYQDFTKYEIPMRKSLLLDRETDPDRMKEVLDAVGLTDVVANLPHGLDTTLGKLDENSADLSGGQWQLISIARSLLSNAPIHILDEPTASIDPIREAMLYRTFRDVLNAKFAIYITHRLGAAKSADEILVLSGGKVAERGSHDELMVQCGIYCEMYEEQRSWYHEPK